VSVDVNIGPDRHYQWPLCISGWGILAGQRGPDSLKVNATGKAGRPLSICYCAKYSAIFLRLDPEFQNSGALPCH
jgi:hypothetical protein